MIASRRQTEGRAAEAAIVEAALVEDIGEADWTTRWTVPEDLLGRAEIVAREAGVISGSRLARATFHAVDATTKWHPRASDGGRVEPGERLAEVSGSLRTILTGERTALNFLGRLSGVATLSARYVSAVRGTGCRIVDTRKTTPGWRALEKAAVRDGGAENHRLGLHDMVLLKENHIQAAGGLGPALDRVIERARGSGLDVEVEITGVEQLRALLRRKPDERPERVLLDNMSLESLREAVGLVRSSGLPTPLLEASGGVTLDSVRLIAETGVDLISVGALTHSAPPLDLSLLVREEARRDAPGP